MQSNECEETSFSCPDYYMNSILSLSEDPMREIMEYQCNSIPDVPVGVSIGLHMGLEAPFCTYEVKQDGVNSFELAGPPCLSPHEITRKRRHDTSVRRLFQWSLMNCPLASMQQFNHLLPKEETVSMEPHMNMEWQHVESHAFPVDAVKMEEVAEFGYNLKGDAVTSDVSKNISREYRQRSRTAESEHSRRSLVTERLQVLQDLLPSSSKVRRRDPICTIDDIIANVKYLQLQLKELSRSSLGGEAFCPPLTFVEGYGHFHPHEQMLKEPFEEIFGSLLEENEVLALGLLEQKGFYMVPQTSLDGLCSAE